MSKRPWKEGLDRDKFVATVLYLLRGCGQHPPGVTALVKLLWYADYWHYRRHLRPITGARYVALENGPVLDDYKSLLRSLSPEFVTVAEVPVQRHEHPKQEFRARVEPDESLLEESEVEVLEEVIARLGRFSGKRLIKKTHEEPAWIFAWDEEHPGTHIPYTLFRWTDNLPSDDSLDAARAILAGRPDILDAVKTEFTDRDDTQ